MFFSSTSAPGATRQSAVINSTYIDRITNPRPSGTGTGRPACADVDVSRHGRAMIVRRYWYSCLSRRIGKNKGSGQKKRRDHRHSAFV